MADRPSKARLVKLVRDRVKAAMPGDERVLIAPIPDRETALGLLRAKLIEEAIEYLLDPSPEELADVLEVVHGLAMHDMKLGKTEQDCMRAIEFYRELKLRDRGGFTEMKALYIVGPGETL